jgi:RNA polymerase sigma-70 factor (ECF subfamily)
MESFAQTMDWESIYRQHSGGVYQYLLSLSHHSQEAEDLLQETFIRAMKSVSSLRQPEKIRSWLLTIARNLFFDSYKQRLRQNAGSLETTQEAEIHRAMKVDSVEDQVIREDFSRCLNEALEELPEPFRTAFTLGVVQRLSYQEIEEVTGWSMAMVKTNIFRARKRVAAELSDFMR